MANYRTSKDLKREILKKCGELQDGSSGYESDALTYLVTAYRGVISGGNEFGIDVAEPWSWALARKPIVLSLMPPYDLGAIALTYGSNFGAFTIPPAISLTGWHLQIEGAEDYCVIRQHEAGNSSFQIDQSYPGVSFAASEFRCVKIDYDLVDDDIVIDASNNRLDFVESTTPLVAVLSPGVYSPSGFAAHLQTRMRAAGSLLYVHAFDPVQRLYTFSAPSPFSMKLATGANVGASPGAVMGLDVADYAGFAAYTSVYAVNAINRLCAPMQVYGRGPEGGKIYEVDFNTLVRKHPMASMVQGIPDRYAIVGLQPNGIATVRFNGYPGVVTRVEVPYIPEHRDLQDSDASIPIVPLAYRDYLVFAACYFLMLDKSDNRSESMAALAKAKLLSLVHHNRKGLSLAGTSYGRLRPRASSRRRLLTETP